MITETALSLVIAMLMIARAINILVWRLRRAEVCYPFGWGESLGRSRPERNSFSNDRHRSPTARDRAACRRGTHDDRGRHAWPRSGSSQPDGRQPDPRQPGSRPPGGCDADMPRLASLAG